jgi:hypothetical protein
MPRHLVSTFLATAAEGDRLSLEPYHVAAEMERGPYGRASAEAEAAIAEARRRQAELATKGISALLGRLNAEGGVPQMAALLVNRAGWVTDLTSYSLAFAEHAAVAEGLAVREALRLGCRGCGLQVVELDEKALPGQAAEVLRLDLAEIEPRLKLLGAAAGRPWRKEQKLACLAAWMALARGD